MRKPLALAGALALLALGHGLARADLASADAKLLGGDYAGAIREYKKIRGKDAPRATVQLGRTLLRTGEYGAAETAAKAASRAVDKRVAADALVLQAEVLRATGRFAAARAVLEKLTASRPEHLRARCLLGLLYRDVGETALAAAQFQKFVDDYNDGTLDQKDAEALLYTAIAVRSLGDYDSANDTFRDAVTADPELLEANIEWGLTFLEKYAAGYAEKSFEEVLKIDPAHPDARVGMARVKIEQGDVRAALDEIELALDANPRHVGALTVRAGLEIENEQYEEAERTLAAALAVNPNDTGARAMRAASCWLRDDRAGYEAERKAAFAVNPKFAAFYHVVADFADKAHRYRESIQLEQEALKTDPGFYLAEAAIGIGYLRLGDEKQGLEYLNKAADKDPYNVRAYNTLKLFDETIPRDYVSASSRTFRFRVPRGEKALLERYVPRTLEAAYADMVKRYHFTPTLPVVIEMYASAQEYSVRTIGLPNLGALGVCFGRIITALSPSNGNVNWGMVLWHELGHVFALQMSGNRVPRWFTEGLSEYETLVARPEWRRENDADIYVAVQEGRLPSVAELNGMFLRARDIQEMVVAYHLSSLTVDFIVRRWGFPRVVQALKLFGQGKDTEEVLRQVTGLDVAGFDAEFRKDLDRRLAPYRGTFLVRLGRYSNVAALEKAAAARPDDAETMANLALGRLAAGEADPALEAANKALALDPANRKALYVQAELAVLTKDYGAAADKLEALIAAGGDGYDARIRLGTIAIKQGDAARAEAELERAKRLDPERGEPYLLLADLYRKQKRDLDALAQLEHYVLIEEADGDAYRKLLEGYAARGRWDKVRQYGEMALFVLALDGDTHLTLGRAYLEGKQPAKAIYEYESALLADPPLKRPAVAHTGLARACLAKRDVARARRAVKEALKLEPRNAEALALKRRVGL